MKTAQRKTITARYEGTCEACRKPIEIGQRIVACAGVYNAWDHKACGVTEPLSLASGWIVVFADGHEEHVDTRSFKDAKRIAQTRHNGQVAVMRRAR